MFKGFIRGIGENKRIHVFVVDVCGVTGKKIKGLFLLVKDSRFCFLKM